MREFSSLPCSMTWGEGFSQKNEHLTRNDEKDRGTTSRIWRPGAWQVTLPNCPVIFEIYWLSILIWKDDGRWFWLTFWGSSHNSAFCQERNAWQQVEAGRGSSALAHGIFVQCGRQRHGRSLGREDLFQATRLQGSVAWCEAVGPLDLACVATGLVSMPCSSIMLA